MFYILRSLSLNKHCYAWDNLSFIDWKRVICEKCGRTVSTAQMDEGCLKLELDGGSAYPDLLQFTGAGPRLFLLSGRALDAFTENGITGIAKAEQVSLSWISTKAKRAVSSPIPTYYSIDIDGRIDYCFKAMFLKKRTSVIGVVNLIGTESGSPQLHLTKAHGPEMIFAGSPVPPDLRSARKNSLMS